jgi:hypothetical protein
MADLPAMIANIRTPSWVRAPRIAKGNGPIGPKPRLHARPRTVVLSSEGRTRFWALFNKYLRA